MLKKLVSVLFSSGNRFWTLEEVRALVASGELDAARDAAGQLYEAIPQRDLIRRCILAEIAFRQHLDAEAESGYREVLKIAPGFADAHYGLSLLLLEQGQTEAAIEHAQFSKNINPNDARYLAQLGLCQITIGNYPSAEIPLLQALRLNDMDKASWNNLGLVLLAKEEPGEAHACFSKALKLDPTFQSALENLARLEEEMKTVGAGFVRRPPPSADVGDKPVLEEAAPWEVSWTEVNALRKAGSNDAALARAEEICLEWPDLPGPVCELDALYRKLGDFRSGMDALRAYLIGHPEDGQALAALGGALLEANENMEAIRYLTLAREAGYETAEMLTNLARALNNQEKHAEALEVRRLVFELEPDFMHQAQLASNLVTACQYEEAIELFEDLLEKDSARKNLFLISYAVAQAYTGHFDKALTLLDEALAVQPHDANLHLQRAQINLLLGNFEQGWDDYSYRGLAYSRQYRVLPFTKWRGQDLAGKCIVILTEQGLGDQVMFASCLPDLLALSPARVVLEAIGRVAPTLARSFPDLEVVHTKQDRGMEWAKALGEVDYFVPLGDLPQYFRKSADKFPGSSYLKADPERVAYWRGKLESTGPRPWIGVSWRGGLQATRRILRSMSPADLAPLASGIDATWISLQYGSVEDDLKTAADANFTLTHWPEGISDLDEFAALIEALDVVVTVCNTTVHYAGALGKKVLVLAPHVPEWRYGLSTPRMPWYADVTVLRQSEFNEWTTVVAHARDRLVTIFASQRQHLSQFAEKTP